MQTTETTLAISSTYRRNPKSRSKSISNQPRCAKHRPKGTPAIPCARNAFLKTVFQPIPAYLAGCGIQFSTEEIKGLTDKTPTYIVESANNCLQKLGSSIRLQSTSNLDHDCFIVQKALSEKLSEGQAVKFGFQKGKFSLSIKHTYWEDFPQYDLFYLSIGKLEKMCSVTADLFKQFVSYYAKSQNICYATDYGYYVYKLEYLEQYYYDDDVSMNEYEEACKVYEDEGVAFKTFAELKKMSVSSVELRSAIQAAYKDTSNVDDELMTLMLQGIDLFETDSIANYSTFVEGDIPFIHLFAIMWKEDVLMEDAIENLNVRIEDSNEFPMPKYLQFVTPDSLEPLFKTQFPVEFAKWWNKFYHLLKYYE